MKTMDMLRRMVPGPIKTRLKRTLGLPLTRLQDEWHILQPIGPVYRPHVVLDVGAFVGWFFHSWLDWCPQGTVHAFEPAPVSFKNLFERYKHDPRIILRNLGVGEKEGELTLKQMTDSPASNSFLAHNAQAWKQIQYETGDIVSATVPVTTLDAYCSANELKQVYLLKIDVQGYEMQVLRGAPTMLAFTDHVLVESAIQPLYEGGANFTEVFAFLTAQGFHLANLRAWHRGNHVLMETDLLFRRNSLMSDVVSSVEKIYL